MGGFFAVASTADCVTDLFFGTDYHSHLGTKRGGLACHDGRRFHRYIHNIENAPFRSKFETDILAMKGRLGVGVISNTEDQPLVIHSHLGGYAIVTVGAIRNIASLTARALSQGTHLAEISDGQLNQTELVATLINQGRSIADGIRIAQDAIDGSCSMLLLTKDSIYAARDKFGRTPIAIGRRDGAWAATLETCAFPNLGFRLERQLGPGEIVRLRADGVEVLAPPQKTMQICSFLWVYYGYPASSYEGVNAEAARYRCGAMLAKRDNVEVDCVAGIPDSGIGHAMGYATAKGLPFHRPFVKYTPTWPRSFLPHVPQARELVARMKLIPIEDFIRGQRLLFCEDSIVRGTQLKDTIQWLFDGGAREVHMRVACPPLLFGCRYLNFARSRNEMDLAARQAISELEGDSPLNLCEYTDPDGPKYHAMVERIRRRMNLTTLKYQRLEDLVEAIGLPRENLCTYCWNGSCGDGCEGGSCNDKPCRA